MTLQPSEVALFVEATVRTRGRPLNDRYAAPRSCIHKDDAVRKFVKCIIQNVYDRYFAMVALLESVKIQIIHTNIVSRKKFTY